MSGPAIPTATGRFALVVAVAVAPVLATLAVFGWLMVISGDAALLIAAVVLVAAVIALAGAWSIGRRLAAEERARVRADAARRDLVAAVSHDLRTPITALRLLADAIDDEIVDGERRRAYVARMGTHIRALGALIDDLFELSRLEAGEIRWSMQHVALDELVSETVEAMRPQADAKGIRVSAEPAGPAELAATGAATEAGSAAAPLARANPEQVQRVLFNLIQNAIRHTPADGSVVVHTRPTRAGVEVEVADTGAGVAPADRERVFAPFYRGGADAARSGDGAGLGLAVARAIVEAHGGRIWLAEAPQGTRVRFTLPAAARPRGAGA